jgi:hypothetical protein
MWKILRNIHLLLNKITIYDIPQKLLQSFYKVIKITAFKPKVLLFQNSVCLVLYISSLDTK